MPVGQPLEEAGGELRFNGCGARARSWLVALRGELVAAGARGVTRRPHVLRGPSRRRVGHRHHREKGRSAGLQPISGPRPTLRPTIATGWRRKTGGRSAAPYCRSYTATEPDAAPCGSAAVWVIVRVLFSFETTAFAVVIAFPAFFQTFS